MRGTREIDLPGARLPTVRREGSVLGPSFLFGWQMMERGCPSMKGHCGAGSRKCLLSLHCLISIMPQLNCLLPVSWASSWFHPTGAFSINWHGIWPTFSVSSYSLGLQESSESSTCSPSHVLNEETSYTSCRRSVFCRKTGALESGLCMLHKVATRTNSFLDVTKK